MDCSAGSSQTVYVRVITVLIALLVGSGGGHNSNRHLSLHLYPRRIAFRDPSGSHLEESRHQRCIAETLCHTHTSSLVSEGVPFPPSRPIQANELVRVRLLHVVDHGSSRCILKGAMPWYLSDAAMLNAF